MEEVFVVYGYYSPSDMPLIVSWIEHETYEYAVNEITNLGTTYSYYKIEKLFKAV